MLYASLVLLNGDVYTFNPRQPRAEAIAVFDDKIVYVGDDRGAKGCVGPTTKVLNLKGKVVLPGFIDAHIHLASYGKALSALDLRGMKSIKQIKEAVRERAKRTPSGAWILGRGWDQEVLEERRMPTRWDLDEATEEHPVALRRVCGHVCVVNSKALRMADVDESTPPPKGGRIDKDSVGRLTGILYEGAQELVLRAAEPTEEELVSACSLACEEAVRCGLTSVHWIVSSSAELRAIKRVKDEGKLTLRVYALMPVDLLDHLKGLGLWTGLGDPFLKVGAIKVFADGSLGARTAALRRPYDDDPSNYGMLVYSPDELKELVVKAHEAKLQLAIHAIGDKAVEAALNALEEALRRPTKHHRHRIEHCSILDEDLIKRMKGLGIIASVQPHFVVSDFWIVSRVGLSRARWVYAFKSLLKSGIVVCGGSDCPVEPIQPLLGAWACVVKHPIVEERLSVEEALKLYTINAAFASFEEDVKGSIEVGKLADFVVLNEDPFEVDPNRIKDIEVLMTIIGGKVVYSKFNVSA